ncbi:hypothetical protein J6X15_00195, partial [Candidatus Saccharibacteria bacterium]|nr:hypothetical protein [Candidatus Saccharibacteria bacterium]
SNADAEYDSTLTRAGEVVQNIIIAKRVLITSRVSRIDAIIIADEVNTCAFKSINDVKDYSLAAIGNIDADDCNNQLHFRGPVITKKITLNRTYGAGSGNTSVQRAEIFDLNPYTYLWSFGQMARYSQAVTVYSRELPTRY